MSQTPQDQPKFLARVMLSLLNASSNYLAAQPGRPVVIGIVILVFALIVQVVNVFIGNDALAVVGIVANSVGIILALIGILLVEPLGGR